jgi:hypothetical protein
MTWKVRHDPYHLLALFSGGDHWIIVDDGENIVASGFESEVVALSHISPLEESGVSSEKAN